LSDARKEAGRSGSEIALIVSETVFLAIRAGNCGVEVLKTENAPLNEKRDKEE
jgi:hypothetical protein